MKIQVAFTKISVTAFALSDMHHDRRKLTDQRASAGVRNGNLNEKPAEKTRSKVVEGLQKFEEDASRGVGCAASALAIFI